MPALDFLPVAHRRLAAWRTALLLLLLLAGSQSMIQAAAATEVGHAHVSLDAVTSGMLLARADADAPGMHRPLPAVDNHIRVRVSGPLARTVVRQRFRNPSDDWIEAIYAFPLPDDAAVDRLRLRVGDRVIEGEIQERQQARQTYETARDSGQRTALVEQHRPNLFTTAVANIAPQAEITVEIEYQHMLDWRDARFSLRVPMAITPRYAGAGMDDVDTDLAMVSGNRDGWLLLPGTLDNAVPLDMTGTATTTPVDLQVHLTPGFPLAQLDSHYHAVERDIAHDGRTVNISLQPGETADRDFLLSWSPRREAVPQAAFFSEERAGEAYGLLMLMPPSAELPEVRAVPRETIFVLDVSGSMSGSPIRAAKASLQQGLARLKPDDHFNIVVFNHNARRFSARSQQATPQAIAAAQRWVDGLSASGGTELLKGLQLALASRAAHSGALRQIVFITDGAIYHHEALFQEIDRNLGADRLFTVGIGHAPNAHLLTEMAHFGRGTSTYIARLDEVQVRMSELFATLERPMLTDIRLTLPGGADIIPASLPDLYAGEPLQVFMKLDAMPHHVTVEGRRGDTPWRNDIALPPPALQSGISQAWAREKIRQWERAEVRGADRDAVRSATLALALDHHLVSRFTSLVAVDRTPARVREEMLRRHALAGELPHGIDHTDIRLAQTATPATLLLMIAVLLLMLAGSIWQLARSRA